MSTCPRAVAIALKLPLIAWHTPPQILTDTGLKERSDHFVCLHEIFGDKTAILDGLVHTHIMLSIRAANHKGYRFTFQPIREEVQIHNAQNELLACTEQQKHKRPTMFYLDNAAFSSRQSTTSNLQTQEWLCEPTTITTDPHISFDLRANMSVCPNSYVRALELQPVPWESPVTCYLQDGTSWSSMFYVRLGGAFGDRVAVVDGIEHTILSVPVANRSGFAVIFSDRETILLLNQHDHIIHESSTKTYVMDLVTVIRELYNTSDRGTWSESNEQFQLELWNFVSENQVDHLTAFLDSRIRSHLVVEESSGDNLLIQAARCSRAELVSFLADKGVFLDHQNNDGDSALIVACENGDEIMAEVLLNYCGTSINLNNLRGENALMRACTLGHEDLALSLIDKGADTTCTNTDLDSTLTVACRRKLTQLAITIASGEHYSLLNNKGLDGATSLMVACNLGLEEVVACLLDNNADATLRDTSGAGCLEAAVCGQQKNIIKLLITKGLDSHLTDLAFLRLIQSYTQIGMLNNPNSNAQTWELETSQIVRFYNKERNWRRRSCFIIFVHNYTKRDTNHMHAFYHHEQSILLNIVSIRELLELIVSFI